MDKGIINVVSRFSIGGEVISATHYGGGHINRTFLVTTTEARYTLQEINAYVFKDIAQLTENIGRVCGHIAKKREGCIQPVPTVDGGYTLCENDRFYRMYTYVDGVCIDQVTCPQDMYLAGRGYGRFQADLADFNEKLHETIPFFHDTRRRYDSFEVALTTANAERIALAKEEIAFFRENVWCADAICSRMSEGSLPLRVTHNDTKINNIIFDSNRKNPLCVIDLDTVMSGSVLYDYGDSIRSGGGYAAEDEEDVSIIKLDLELFRAFTKGFAEETRGILTQTEVENLHIGAIVMTYECGMRFLTDFLQGDVYFRTEKPNHNLIRARAHVALMRDMLIKKEKMKEIVYAEFKG